MDVYIALAFLAIVVFSLGYIAIQALIQVKVFKHENESFKTDIEQSNEQFYKEVRSDIETMSAGIDKLCNSMQERNDNIYSDLKSDLREVIEEAIAPIHRDLERIEKHTREDIASIRKEG